jgi:hypothetical protein
MNTGIISSHLIRWTGLAVIALVELTWLALRIEMPSTGILSCLKGIPSIFLISLMVIAVLVWAGFRGKFF